jgi:hypothetical protein
MYAQVFGVYAKKHNTYRHSSQSDGAKKFSHNKSETGNGESEPEFWVKIGTDLKKNPI